MGIFNSDRDVVFLAARRTPFGTFGGSLKDHSAIDLGVLAARAALEDVDLEPSEIDHAVFGNALQTSPDAIYLARHIALKAGLPVETPALTLNRLCGSGFEAIVEGARQILLAESEACLVGGTESMSQAPHVVWGARWGLRLGPGPELQDLLWAALTDTYCGFKMAETAENLAEVHDISREDADVYAERSQRTAKEAWDSGVFEAESVPITIRARKGEKTFDRDEHMRPETTLEGLSKLPAYFKKDGTVTAGNASGIGDGAAALVIASAEFAERKNIKPLARLVSWGVAGVPPEIMGIGPVPASRLALERAGLGLEDMDLIEVNEAFAPQYLAVEKELGLDRDRVNVHGGAIAITHPLAATGARITGHLIHALRMRGLKLGLGSACIGGGQGMAVVIEALE
ncbi:MAG: acetyl-CoA C-acetyltransferase [Candidatus Palauibacterales bacterium]|nr:acetyl-CoA C-acetyltransferase [Candidatus Palauibacterales bacterium]